MLSKADNELLCRVGPGTPMGELMRQYWQPLLMSWELEPDGAPKRVRVLGEDLIAFRDTSGRPGFVGDHCPHRGASLFFGRNEEDGLRCVYHGWKFDVSGACTDMPNEPPESNFKDKVRATAYRAADWGGIIWVYLGPRQENPPGLPEFEWCTVPQNQVQFGHKTVYECNWAQALEGELDTTHVYFLHSRLDPSVSPKYGLWAPDRRSRLEILDTDYGVLYGARRQEDAEHYYWRTTHFLFPMYGMWPGGGEEGTVPLSIYVPIDDEHTLHWGIIWHPSQPHPMADVKPGRQPFSEDGTITGGVGPMKPHQTGRFFADWWPVANKENDFMTNREVKKRKSFTGIPTVRLQDDAVITSMGPILDRSNEHLGTMDAMVIRVRRRLMEAARKLASEGITPPGVENPEWYRVRSCQAILPISESWQERMDDWHHGRTTEHPTGGFQPIGVR